MRDRIISFYTSGRCLFRSVTDRIDIGREAARNNEHRVAGYKGADAPLFFLSAFSIGMIWGVF